MLKSHLLLSIGNINMSFYMNIYTFSILPKLFLHPTIGSPHKYEEIQRNVLMIFLFDILPARPRIRDKLGGLYYYPEP